MKLPTTLVLIIFLIFSYAKAQTLEAQTQEWIEHPNNISEDNFQSFINTCNDNEGMSKITSINCDDSIISFSTSDFWPQGTWKRGYYDDSISFCKPIPPGTAPQKFFSCHPLVRINSKMIRALIHTTHLLRDSLPQVVLDSNIQNIKQGIDYMLTQQWFNVFEDTHWGGFIYWQTRSGIDAIDNVAPLDNRPHTYETAQALRAMCEAYMYFEDYNISYPNMSELYAAIDSAAVNLKMKSLDNGTDQTDNSNFQGYALWGLASAYKVTSDTTCYNKAKVFANHLIHLQKDTGVQVGTWLTGTDAGENTLNADCDTTVNVTVFHDSRIHYFGVILRGLVEMMDITPNSDATFKTNLVNAIKRSLNHFMQYRFAYYFEANANWQHDPLTNTFYYASVLPGMLRINFLTTDGLYTCPIWGYDYETEVMESIAMLTLYSEFSTYFSCEERQILRNLLLTYGNAVHINYIYGIAGGDYLERFTNYAYYADYFQAYENHERIFPGFENNDFVNLYEGITNIDNYTISSYEIIEHSNEINFTDLSVESGATALISSGVRIKCSGTSHASSGSSFHALITDTLCPGLARMSNPYANTNQHQVSGVNHPAQIAGKPISEKEKTEKIDFKIIPNPNTGKFTFTISEKINSIIIYNLLGEVMYKSDDNSDEIDLSNRAKGIYFVKAQTAEKIFTQKLVIQ